jgi:hypothetical protein
VHVYYRETAVTSDPPNIVSNGGTETATISIAENSASPGTLIWGSGAFSSAQETLDSAEAVDTAGNVVTTGFFQGTIDVDPGPGTVELTSTGGFDLFVSKLDDAGNHAWAFALGGAGSDRGAGVTVDEVGAVYLTGYFQDTVDFDPGEESETLTAGGVEDVFVAKFDANGALVWVRSFGGSDDVEGSGVAVDQSGGFVSVEDFVTDVDATDSDGDTEGDGLTYRFTTVRGGTDNEVFTIDPETGLLGFVSAPDFENPADIDTDNVYDVEVTVTDSRGLTDSQRMRVRITDVAEDP